MKKIKILGLIAILFWANSCKDFEDMQVNPNKPTQVHPGLLLTNIEAAEGANTSNVVPTFNVIDVGAMLASRMLVYTQTPDNNQYYGWQRNSFRRYNTLAQIAQMELEANRLQLPNYNALALFLKSVNIIELTKTFGDVPYSEAMMGNSGLFTPVYDAQESIYIKVLDDLKAANSALDPTLGAITGDVIYGGDFDKWKKLINSYSLRILMSLSNKEGNATLDVENRFQEIVNDPVTYPIFTSNEDNAALHFQDLVDNRYPYFNNNSFSTDYYMDESFVDLLQDFQDPRLFTFAEPKPNGSGIDDDFDAYDGLGGSDVFSENTIRVANGEASRIDERFYHEAVNEPSLFLSYAEVEFTLAEAAERGWITDDPADHYELGIRASFDFYGLDDTAQDDYLAQPAVIYVPADGIEMIITQKYINFYMQGGWEAFFNHLRTGFPEFSVDGGGILNPTVPLRWMYPQAELDLNEVNVEAAISRQFGSDDINGEMWLYQTE